MMKTKLKFLFASLAVLLAVWIVFGQCLSFQFLRFDDHDYTFFCPFVRTGLTLENIKNAFTNFTHAAIWMPITYMTYMLDVSLWRGTAGAFHAGNVLIHSINALLVFMFSLSLVKAFGCNECRKKSFSLVSLAACAFIAILWAVHPQRVESVAWIAGRKDLLCTMFVLLGTLAWGKWSKHRYMEESGNMITQVLLWIAGLLCCLAACMCKPAAMCIPALFLSVEGVYFSCRVNSSFSKRKMVLSFLLRYLPVFIMAAATGALAVYSQTHAEGYGVRELFSASLPWRLLNAAVSAGRYLFMSLIPVGIHLDYRAIPEGLPIGTFTGLASLLLVAVMFGVLWKKFSRVRVIFLATAVWFVSSLVPTLGIFGSFGEHAMADRFHYLPSLAFVLLAAVCFAKFYDDSYFESGKNFWKSPVCFVVVNLLLLFAATSFVITRSYRNDLAVFTRTLKCDSEHGRALAHVGEGECAEGKLDEGIEKLRKSMKLRPRFDTSAKLSYALMRRGKGADYKEIRALCADVLKNRKLDQKGQALEAIGTAALVERKWQEALDCLYDSIRAPRRFYSPEDAKLKLAYALYNVGRKKDAMRVFSSLEHSTRSDIASRASQAMETIHSVGKGNVVLFW